MPEQPTARIARRASRMTWSLVCALPLCGIPAGAIAQSVPPSLRACTAEPDSTRLACYDREMARLLAQAVQSEAAPPPPPPPPAAAPPPPPQSSAPPASPMAQAPRADVSTPATSPTPTVASTEATTPSKPSLWKSFVGGSASRVTAQIASLDRSPNSMVLHLDNGQVWQQIGPASGDLTLHVGDSVTIERNLGSYWLSSRYVSDMKVRLQTQ
ncbi:MAG TPA: hypothetical protein VHY36_12775 [Steroidobacteraceae bacterium]|nr:hypothetical protein [Steroidobacteraceae bacterium]